MKRLMLGVVIVTISLMLASCGGEKIKWEAAVEKSTFTEIDQSIPTVREALMDLHETINKRITSKKYRNQALDKLKEVSDFVDILQFYYLPILNARAHIARAYREIGHGMYTEAKDDIAKAVDLINKASLKATEKTKSGFDEVKRGLLEVKEISDATAETNLVKLANAAKKLNILIERIKPTVVVTEEGESLIEGQI